MRACGRARFTDAIFGSGSEFSFAQKNPEKNDPEERIEQGPPQLQVHESGHRGEPYFQSTLPGKEAERVQPERAKYHENKKHLRPNISLPPEAPQVNPCADA